MMPQKLQRCHITDCLQFLHLFHLFVQKLMRIKQPNFYYTNTHSQSQTFFYFFCTRIGDFPVASPLLHDQLFSILPIDLSFLYNNW